MISMEKRVVPRIQIPSKSTILHIKIKIYEYQIPRTDEPVGIVAVEYSSSSKHENQFEITS